MLRSLLFGSAVVLACGIGSRLQALVISEIHYHPREEDESLEFVELTNSSSTPVDLSGYAFTAGISFEFPRGSVLPGRGVIVVCRDAALVREHYGIDNAVGGFTGRLDNTGERLTLTNHAGVTVQSLSFRDQGKWPGGADGTGYSLVLRSIYLDPKEPESWTLSPELGGSPGRINFADGGGPVFVDEVVVDRGAAWRYAKGSAPFSDPADAWLDPAFDDSSWLEGPTGIGFADDDDATVLEDMRGSYASVACRKRFVVGADELAQAGDFVLGIDYDDGFCAFLNGHAVASANCDPADGVPAADDTASGSREAGEEEVFPLPRDLLVAGENVVAICGYNLSSGGNDFSLIPRILRRRPIDGGSGGPARVAFNELYRGAAAGAGWVEIHNPGAAAVDLAGYRLTDTPERPDPLILDSPAPLPARGFLVIDESRLPFSLALASVQLFLLDPQGRPAAVTTFDRAPPLAPGAFSECRYPDGGPLDWVSTTPTRGAPNEVQRPPRVVINEILYHPISGRPGEFLELHNTADAAVDIGGFRFEDGIDYQVPAGTTLGSGAFLVIAEDPDYIQEHYGVAALGPWTGRLANTGEALRLVDALGNPVDFVRYHPSGAWSLWADGRGSSLEKIDARQDGSFASAWAASDESAKSQWQEFRFEVEDYVPARESELHLHLVERGICLVDDISVSRDGENHISNPGFETATTGWIIGGTHVRSRRETAESRSGDACLRIEATGKGDTLVNRIECETRPRLSRGPYTVSLWARWIAGSGALVVHGEYHGGPFRKAPCVTCGVDEPNLSGNSLSAAVRFDIPFDLGTPGRRNSATDRHAAETGSGNLGPVIDSVRHEPAIPAPGQAVLVTARISDADGVAGGEILYRLGDATGELTSTPLHDDGAHGDGEAGDGIWGGSIPGQTQRSRVVFFVSAADRLGAERSFPVEAPERTLLYLVQDELDDRIDVFSYFLDARRARELETRELHSNDLVEGTFVFPGAAARYNVGVRYRGSPWGRPSRASHRVRFPEDDLFHRGWRDINVSKTGGSASEASALFLTVMSGERGRPAPVPEYHFVQVYFNGTAIGMKGAIETIDGRFLEKWHGDGADGPLLKANGRFTFTDGGSLTGQQGWEGASLIHRGESPENYRGYFFHSVRQSAEDWEPLIRLTRVLDRGVTEDDEFARQVESVVDLDSFFRILGSRILLGDGDGFAVNNGHNGYVVFNSFTGQASLGPFDLEATFWSSPDLFQSLDPGVQRLLGHPKTRRVYLRILGELLQGYWSADGATPWLVALQRATGHSTGGVRNHIAGGARRIEAALRGVENASFRIVTESGEDFSTGDAAVEIEGEAPIAVETIAYRRGAEDPRTLEPTWSSVRRWSVVIPLAGGRNELEFLGFDRASNIAGSARIAVTREGAADPEFVRGDSNRDGGVDVSDAVDVLRHLFLGAGKIGCEKAADADDSGRLDLSDALRILGFLFLDGSPPPAPHPACGIDETPDELECLEAGACSGAE